MGGCGDCRRSLRIGSGNWRGGLVCGYKISKMNMGLMKVRRCCSEPPGLPTVLMLAELGVLTAEICGRAEAWVPIGEMVFAG